MIAVASPLSGHGSTLRAFGLREFLAMPLPPRAYLLDPILPERGLAMIYASRGVGKTWAALSLGYAVASGGSFLKWMAPAPRRVLYLDGEMPAQALQERLAAIAAGAAGEPPSFDHFRILAADCQELGLPDLSTREGQDEIESHIAAADLVILDNLSTLARSGKENEAESWSVMQEWLLRLRRNGRSVLLVHHAGKGGAQRGTSKREDALDTVIALRWAQDRDPMQGAQFELHFEKARGVAGEAVAGIEATLHKDEGGASWTYRPLDDALGAKVAAMREEGCSIREIAQELGKPKSTIHRMAKRLGEAEKTRT